MKTKSIFVPSILMFLLSFFYCCNPVNNDCDFSAIETGLGKANQTLSTVNEQINARFKLAYLNDPEKCKKYYDKAKYVNDLSRKLFDYLENLKQDHEELLRNLPDLKHHVNHSVAGMLDLSDNQITVGLNPDSTEFIAYEAGIKNALNNNNMVRAGVMLSMIQQSIKGIEFNVLNSIYKEIDVPIFKFDTLVVK